MKQLPDITYHQFKCDFCKRTYKTERGARKHEYKCYYNPERHCPTCNDTGVRQWDLLDPITLGVIPDGGEEVCGACTIALEVGGRSYIE